MAKLLVYLVSFIVIIYCDVDLKDQTNTIININIFSFAFCWYFYIQKYFKVSKLT